MIIATALEIAQQFCVTRKMIDSRKTVRFVKNNLERTPRVIIWLESCHVRRSLVNTRCRGKKCRIFQFQAGLIARLLDESRSYQHLIARNGRDLLVCFLDAIDNSLRYRLIFSSFTMSYIIISKHQNVLMESKWINGIFNCM